MNAHPFHRRRFLAFGAALVLAGITLVSGEQWLRRLLRR